jgi:uncharacterized membrane protein YfcA
MHLSVPEYAVVLAACIVGASVQGAIGFGMNLVVVPTLALVEAEALPAVGLLLAVPITIGMLAHEHAHADRSGVVWVSTGRIPGSLAGAWIVTSVSDATLSAIIGAFVVLAAAMSLVAPPIRVTPASAFATGVASGTMGTASSIGGPPVALLYQHHHGRVVRATLAFTFAIGTAISLTVLFFVGELAWWHVGLAAALAPGIVGGTVLARRLHGRLDRGWIRPAVLGFAAVTGVVAIARGLA